MVLFLFKLTTNFYCHVLNVYIFVSSLQVIICSICWVCKTFHLWCCCLYPIYCILCMGSRAHVGGRFGRWSKAKFKSPCNFEELPYVAARVFSPLVIYKNVDIVHVFIEIYHTCISILKVIFLESNPLRFIETLISFIKGFVYCLYMPSLK